MTTYSAAGYVGVAVVACKTDKGIIRAINTSYLMNIREESRKLIGAIIEQQGALNLEGTEWTGCYYRSMPYYLYKLPESLIEIKINSGVWLFPWRIAPTTERYGCELGISDHDNPIKLGEIPRR